MNADPSELAKLQARPKPAQQTRPHAPDPQRITISALDIPLGDMIVFGLKLWVASIVLYILFLPLIFITDALIK